MIHSDSWEILVEFKITSPNIALSADGLAFWFTPSTYENGQAMGFKTTWNGLGIIIDTYDNADYGFSVPKIIGIVNDGTKKYNKDSNGKEIETASCEMDVKDQSYKTIARIRYHKDRFLSLEFSTKEQDLWKSCFHLTNVTLPSSGYLGFTGLTGGLSENHDIMYVIVRDLEETTSDSIPKTQFEDAILNYETFNTAYNSSFNLWTWSLVLIVALVVGLGYRYLPKMVRKDYQRF
ncbi:hypothetical protein HMI54_005233 [Coelomomyces lativittatus]|nr:hypothetical protein HMI54_005233 [Coelomomyces lativittatus]